MEVEQEVKEKTRAEEISSPETAATDPDTSIIELSSSPLPSE
jgi:hypothetical protein